MILLDNDILSTFAKIKKLDILRILFAQDVLYITSGVLEEVQISLEEGYSYPKYIFDEIVNGKIKILYLKRIELIEKENLPETFGKGEKESIAICKHRNSILLSNEKKVATFCSSQGITAFRLPDILRALWVEKVLSKDKVKN
jgi:predicted nucleic acid-binding protein